jgi:ATP-dependent DNA helicase PIF1
MKIKHSKHSDAVAVTAPTGIAACNVGGVTIHSFGGIGLGSGTAAQLVTKIKKQHKAESRWRNTKVLIIDEGEMGSIL